MIIHGIGTLIKYNGKFCIFIIKTNRGKTFTENLKMFGLNWDPGFIRTWKGTAMLGQVVNIQIYAKHSF